MFGLDATYRFGSEEMWGDEVKHQYCEQAPIM